MPGYETILSNEFYGKEGEPIKVSQEEELPTTDLLCLNRVRIPSKERMINFLGISFTLGNSFMRLCFIDTISVLINLYHISIYKI